MSILLGNLYPSTSNTGNMAAPIIASMKAAVNATTPDFLTYTNTSGTGNLYRVTASVMVFTVSGAGGIDFNCVYTDPAGVTNNIAISTPIGIVGSTHDAPVDIFVATGTIVHFNVFVTGTTTGEVAVTLELMV